MSTPLSVFTPYIKPHISRKKGKYVMCFRNWSLFLRKINLLAKCNFPILQQMVHIVTASFRALWRLGSTAVQHVEMIGVLLFLLYLII
jgi:hypothetical protein